MNALDVPLESAYATTRPCLIYFLDSTGIGSLDNFDMGCQTIGEHPGLVSDTLRLDLYHGTPFHPCLVDPGSNAQGLSNTNTQCGPNIGPYAFSLH